MPEREPNKILPATAYLRESLDYNPQTGELRWRHRPREHFASTRACLRYHTVYAGKIAGITTCKGHLTIGLANAVYLNHRVIWKWMTGEEPPATIDHKDGNGFNNRWDNLRAATRAEQQQNRRKPINSANPYRGVQQASKRRWAAQIMINRKIHRLGSFATPEEAAAAYEDAARRLQGEFYCSRST